MNTNPAAVYKAKKQLKAELKERLEGASFPEPDFSAMNDDRNETDPAVDRISQAAADAYVSIEEAVWSLDPAGGEELQTILTSIEEAVWSTVGWKEVSEKYNEFVQAWNSIKARVDEIEVDDVYNENIPEEYLLDEEGE